MEPMESIRSYYPGGFHPIHIGDTFKHGRYTIVHKLGHGVYSTVWMARDSTTKTYVSVKVLAAEVLECSESSNSVHEELQVLSRLRDVMNKDGEDCVVRLIDNFIHMGPNGAHQCIVTELLGPNLASDIEDLYPDEIFPAEISKAIIRELTYSIQFLHRNNITHGDLHRGNILFASPKLSHLKEDDIAQYFGEADMCMVKRVSDEVGELRHAPRYIVVAPDPTPLLRLCLSNPTDVRVKLCDFSESSIITEETCPKEMKMPFIYRAPEVFLTRPFMPALSADVWSLAVLFHVISTGGRPIFVGGFLRQSEDDIIKDIVLRLGKLPDPLWTAWDKRAQFFHEDGTPLAKSTENAPLLWYRNKLINDEERVLFEELLREMLMLEVEKRATIDDVVTSPWFVGYCAGSSTTPSSVTEGRMPPDL